MVDVDEALHESRELMEMWRDTQGHSESPPFSGGVFDAWPAYAADGLAILRLEAQRIRNFHEAEARRHV